MTAERTYKVGRFAITWQDHPEGDRLGALMNVTETLARLKPAGADSI